MIIFFRLDASADIGNGHLVRCMILAKVFLQKQLNVVFICADITDVLKQLLISEGIMLEKIESFQNELEDAQHVVTILQKYPLGVIVIDHYQLNIAWHQIMAEHVQKIIVIDDLINRPFFCHLLINSGCFVKEAYQQLVPHFCEQMLGPEYVIIKPEYISYKKKMHRKQIERVFIFMGGADSKNITARIIEAFSDSAFDDIQFDLVVGSSNTRKNEIRNAVSTKPNFTLHFNKPHLADLMQLADLGIGAGGTTAWERICVGLPSGIITLAENQVPLTKYLQDVHLIAYIGHHDRVTVENICQFLIREISVGELRKQFTVANQLCDGLGVNRIAQKVLAMAS